MLFAQHILQIIIVDKQCQGHLLVPVYPCFEWEENDMPFLHVVTYTNIESLVCPCTLIPLNAPLVQPEVVLDMFLVCHFD